MGRPVLGPVNLLGFPSYESAPSEVPGLHPRHIGRMKTAVETELEVLTYGVMEIRFSSD